jgi:hypothetical protein
MHLKPTAGCQISTLIFGFGGTLCISHEKLPKDGKVLCHLGLRSKVLPGPLTDLVHRWDNAPEANSRASNINFDIWNWGDPINIP